MVAHAAILADPVLLDRAIAANKKGYLDRLHLIAAREWPTDRTAVPITVRTASCESTEAGTQEGAGIRVHLPRTRSTEPSSGPRSSGRARPGPASPRAGSRGAGCQDPLASAFAADRADRGLAHCAGTRATNRASWPGDSGSRAPGTPILLAG
jgi:hypothetical protein